MKRMLTVIALCVMTFWSSHNLQARGLGIIGGASFTGLKEISADLATGYHAGLTYKFDLPVGFSIQPSVQYHLKRSEVQHAIANLSTFDFKAGYLEVPVSVQWGPDLILFRPFLDFTPYIGYALNNEISGISSQRGVIEVIKNKWDGVTRLEYGLGLGAGLDIWRIQLICRYNWNFGRLFNDESAMPAVRETNFGGVTLTAALFF